MRRAVFLAASAALAARAAEQFIGAADPRLQYVGRFLVNATDGSRAFDWGGTAILVTVTGTAYVKARVAASAGARTKLVVDEPHSPSLEARNLSQGFSVSEFFVDEVAGAMGGDVYYAASGLDANQSYTIRISNALEPLFHGNSGQGYGNGTMSFFGVYIDAGGAALAPPPRRQRSLEWVGDSLTAGFGSRGVRPPCEVSQITSSAHYSYSHILGDALGANTSIISWSGKGVWKNCCGGAGPAMPVLYRQTLGNLPAADWVFGAPPSALAINLGSNDMSQYNGTAQFLRGLADAFEAFVRDATRLYRAPALPVLLVQGPANVSEIFGVLQTVHDELAAEGVNVHRVYAFTDVVDGCSGHPGTRAHAIMAAALEPQVRTILGWVD